MKFIKIYGLNRSGTNYVEWLLRHNLTDVNVLHDANILGWKHGPPRYTIDWSGHNWDDPRIPSPQMNGIVKRYMNVIEPYRKELEEAVENNEVLHVFVFKHPYSWYLSANKTATKNSVGGLLMHDMVSTWDLRNKQYLEYHDKFPETSMIVRYEDFYDNDYSVILENISKHFDLQLNDELVNQTRTIGPRQGIGKHPFNIDYYKKELYVNVFNVSQKAIFKTRIDSNLTDRLNYTL